MRTFLATLVTTCALLVQAPSFAQANDSLKNIYLTTDYPSVTLQAGDISTLNLSLQNHGVPPERFDLSVSGVPKGWKADLLGGGQPVAAAMPGNDARLSLQLRLDIPDQKDQGPFTLKVLAKSRERTLELPVQVHLADELPAKLTLQTDLPQLTGSTNTNFDYQLTVKNDSGKDMLVSLAAQAPRFFDTSFTEGYGSQQINAVPIKAGESKDIKLNVRPPSMAATGEHTIKVTASADGTSATTELKMQLTGQPELSVAGPDGIMSATAQAGSASSVPLIIRNTGSVTAKDISLNATGPNGWDIRFEPAKIDQIEPGKSTTVQASITPSEQSLAGDYMVNVSARAQGQSSDSDLRISVTTSTLWGISGVVLIAIALLVLIGAIARYGRR